MIAAIFLFLVFFVSITGNSLIISTVGSSLTLRRLHYNLLLLQVGRARIDNLMISNIGWCVWHRGDRPEHQFKHSLPSHPGARLDMRSHSLLSVCSLPNISLPAMDLWVCGVQGKLLFDGGQNWLLMFKIIHSLLFLWRLISSFS